MIPRYDSAVTQIVLPRPIAVGRAAKREAEKVDAASLDLVGPLRAREVAVRKAALEPATHSRMRKDGGPPT